VRERFRQKRMMNPGAISIAGKRLDRLTRSALRFKSPFVSWISIGKNWSTSAMSERTSALIYCRVSTRRQEVEGTSLDTQVAACAKHAESLGYSVGRTTREVFSGAELWDRPALARDRADMKSGQFQALVAYSTDRLSRDPIHLAIIADECERAGVALHFVTEPLDSTPEGALIRYVKGYASQIEREKIRERSLRGRKARLESGKIHGAGRELFGYVRDKEAGKRDINDVEADVVRWIFTQFVVEKLAIREIARRLDAEGTPPPSARKVTYQDAGHVPEWGKSTIHRILTEPAYKGDTVTWRRKSVNRNGRSIKRPTEENIRLPEGTSPALVDPMVWEAAQVRLSINKGGSPRLEHDEFLLRRMVECAVCGRAMRPDREHGLRIYRCSSRERHSLACGSHRVPAEDTMPAAAHPRDAAGRKKKLSPEEHKAVATDPGVETWAWDRVSQMLKDPETIAAELRRRQDEGPDPVVEADLVSGRRALQKIDRQQERLVALYAAGDEDFPLDLVKQQITTAERERERWQATIAELESRMIRDQLQVEQLGALQAYCERVAQNLETFGFEDKRLALEALGICVIANGREWSLRGSIPLGPPPEQSSQPTLERPARFRKDFAGTRVALDLAADGTRGGTGSDQDLLRERPPPGGSTAGAAASFPFAPLHGQPRRSGRWGTVATTG
jgi:site-specific DNA recombinase